MKKELSPPRELDAASSQELAALEVAREALRTQLTSAITERLRARGSEVPLRLKIPTHVFLLVRAYLLEERPRFVAEFGSSHRHCHEFDTDALLLIYRALLTE